MAPDQDQDDEDDDLLDLPEDPFEIEGSLDPLVETQAKLEITPLVSARAQLEVFDDDALDALEEELVEDEDAEDWFGTELVAYLGDAIAEKKLTFLDLSAGGYSDALIAEALEKANAAFAELGVRVVSLTDLEITASEEELARLNEQTAAELVAAAPKS